MISPFGDLQMRRRQGVQAASEPDRFLCFYTAEDILLQKLRWYRMGDEVSDRRWRDVLGIVLVHRSTLDEEYLREGARTLGVGDLLETALDEARGGRSAPCATRVTATGAPRGRRPRPARGNAGASKVLSDGTPGQAELRGDGPDRLTLSTQFDDLCTDPPPSILGTSVLVDCEMPGEWGLGHRLDCSEPPAP